MSSNKDKKPIYGKAWFWAIIIVLVFWWATSGPSKSDVSDTPDYSELTEEQQLEKAYEIAKEYVNTKSFAISREVLENELYYEHGFTRPISEEAVIKLEENGEIDFWLEAERAGLYYVERELLSEKGLVDKLVNDDKFDSAEAYEAAYQLWSNKKVDWEENATKVARSLLESDDFDRDELVTILTGEAYQFTPEEAEAAADSVL